MNAMLGLAIIVVIVLTWLYHRFDQHRKTIAFFATLAGAVTAAVFTLQEVHSLARQYSLSIEHHADAVNHRRQEVSFSYIEKWHQLPQGELGELFVRLQDQSPQQNLAMLEPGSDEAKLAEAVLNFFEDAALAADLGFADEVTLCAFFEVISTRAYRVLRQTVEARRATPGHENAWILYERMYKRWDQGCPGEER